MLLFTDVFVGASSGFAFLVWLSFRGKSRGIYSAVDANLIMAGFVFISFALFFLFHRKLTGISLGRSSLTARVSDSGEHRAYIWRKKRRSKARTWETWSTVKQTRCRAACSAADTSIVSDPLFSLETRSLQAIYHSSTGNSNHSHNHRDIVLFWFPWLFFYAKCRSPFKRKCYYFCCVFFLFFWVSFLTYGHDKVMESRQTLSSTSKSLERTKI